MTSPYFGQGAQGGLVARCKFVWAHPGVLVGRAGIVASHIITTSLPKVANCRCWPLRKPSPSPTSTSNDPTPHAIPNMVRKLRSLFAAMARKT